MNSHVIPMESHPSIGGQALRPGKSAGVAMTASRLMVQRPAVALCVRSTSSTSPQPTLAIRL